MSRKRVVSRTITATDVAVMCVEVDAGEVVNKAFTIPHKCNKAEALKEGKKQFETDELKVVAVVDMNEKVYKAEMPEDVFLSSATITPIEQ